MGGTKRGGNCGGGTSRGGTTERKKGPWEKINEVCCEREKTKAGKMGFKEGTIHLFWGGEKFEVSKGGNLWVSTIGECSRKRRIGEVTRQKSRENDG